MPSSDKIAKPVESKVAFVVEKYLKRFDPLRLPTCIVRGTFHQPCVAPARHRIAVDDQYFLLRYQSINSLANPSFAGPLVCFPSVHTCVRPSVRPSVRPFVRPSVPPSARRPLTHLNIYPYIRLSVRPSFRPSNLPPFRPSVRQSVRVCPFAGRPSVRLCPSVRGSDGIVRPRPSVSLSVRPSVTSVRQSLQPSLRSSVHPSVCPSDRHFVRPSLRPSIRPSVRPAVRSFVRPSHRPSIAPSLRPSLSFVPPSLRLSVDARPAGTVHMTPDGSGRSGAVISASAYSCERRGR